MDNQCTVQVKLELGHRAQLRKKPTTEGFTHDWMVFVRGPEQCDIQHFVERVVFRLHESFPKPKRVCKEPPYKVEESGYAGFIMPIEVYFKNKEEPKRVCFTYDLFLNLEGNPPVNHLRCEKLTFNNPTREFRHKLVKAGGVMVMPEGAEAVTRPSPDYPMLPTIPLSAFSDPKKTKPSHGSKEPSKDSSSSKTSKPHKVTKEHRSERPRKDSESKGSSKGEGEREAGKPAKEKVKTETTEVKEVKKPAETDDSNSEDEASSKSESVPSSPSNSSSSSDSSSDSDFEPSQNHTQGPLRSMVEDLQSEESDDDDSSTEGETPVKTNPPNRDTRLSLGSESDSSEGSHPRSRDPPPPPLKHSSANNKVSGRKSPDPCSRPEKMLKKGYDKAYTDELVDLHRRLMALRERNVLQQIVNLIEETGHFNVTNTTFDFDLFSLDESTVRKLQSYLEATAT